MVTEVGVAGRVTVWLALVCCADVPGVVVNSPFRGTEREFRLQLDTALPAGTPASVAVRVLERDGYFCAPYSVAVSASGTTIVNCGRNDVGVLFPERHLGVDLMISDGVLVSTSGMVANRGWP